MVVGGEGRERAGVVVEDFDADAGRADGGGQGHQGDGGVPVGVGDDLGDEELGDVNCDRAARPAEQPGDVIAG